MEEWNFRIETPESHSLLVDSLILQFEFNSAHKFSSFDFLSWVGTSYPLSYSH